MIKKMLKPNPRYIYKLRSILVVLALAVLAAGVAVALLLSQDRSQAHLASPLVKTVLVLDLIWFLPAFSLTKAYYRSLVYEMHDTQIKVSSGVWTQTVRYIPYWSVSGISIKRDMLDRWLEIGTLSIETSSLNGKVGGEQKLVGISDASELIDVLETELLGYRNSQIPELQYRSETKH